MEARDNYIDFLRFLGLSLIVIAHINAPPMLTQLRAFDVPLMIFASGLAYGTKNKVSTSWRGFYWPRIKRLLIPVYLFLPFYLLLLYIAGVPVSAEMCMRSFLLTLKGSIGYVWIIRVFLLITLVTPFLISLKNNLRGWQIPCVILVFLIANEMSATVFSNIDELSIGQELYVEIVPYLLGYSSLFLLGLIANSIYVKQKMIFDKVIQFSVLAVVMLVFYRLRVPIYNGDFSFVNYKFPPKFLFLAYGIIWCLIIYGLKTLLYKLSESKFVLFVGRNTIWIYLWHMIFVIIGNKYLPFWIERYAFVFGASVISYYVQHRFVNYIEKKYSCEFVKYFRG